MGFPRSHHQFQSSQKAWPWTWDMGSGEKGGCGHLPGQTAELESTVGPVGHLPFACDEGMGNTS